MKEMITSYIEEITDESNENFIPKEDRIAAFDMDGTIIQENPISLWYSVTASYIMDCKQDDTEIYEKAKGLLEQSQSNQDSNSMAYSYSELAPVVFSGMEEDAIADYVAELVQTKKQDSLGGRTFVESFYQPMVELIQYLVSKDFEIYVVSGSDRAVIWGAFEGYNQANPDNPIPIDRAHMIGTDPEILLTKTKDTSNLCGFMPDQKLVRGNKMAETNLDIHKVSRLYHQCGKLPVVVGGNSSGDYALFNMAKSSPHKSLVLLLAHDDSREVTYGMSKMGESACATFDWKWVSMKKEFREIY